MATFYVNGARQTFNVPDDAKLWDIREKPGLTGTKFGCGVAQYGAAPRTSTARPVRSCQTAVGQLEDTQVTTIEGLSPDGSHPLQKAWTAEQVLRCGYQSRQIVQAAALLATNGAR